MIKNIITHRAELDFVLSKTEIEKESYVEPNVLRVLVFEQLFRNKAIPCNSRTALIVIKNKRALETALAEYRSTLNSELHKPLCKCYALIFCCFNSVVCRVCA